jgi:hypothetical protein
MESVYETQAASGELETLRALVYTVLPYLAQDAKSHTLQDELASFQAVK